MADDTAQAVAVTLPPAMPCSLSRRVLSTAARIESPREVRRRVRLRTTSTISVTMTVESCSPLIGVPSRWATTLFTLKSRLGGEFLVLGPKMIEASAGISFGVY